MLAEFELELLERKAYTLTARPNYGNLATKFCRQLFDRMVASSSTKKNLGT